jgi:hypothetical protein
MVDCVKEGSVDSAGFATTAGVWVADFDLVAEDTHHPSEDFAQGRIVVGPDHKSVLPSLAAIVRSVRVRQHAVEHSAVRAGG